MALNSFPVFPGSRQASTNPVQFSGKKAQHQHPPDKAKETKDAKAVKDAKSVSGRQIFYAGSVLGVLAPGVLGAFFPPAFALYALTLPVIGLGVHDIRQKEHALRRNFPVIGHFRYGIEEHLRDKLQQYAETPTDGAPFTREQRETVYQRAKNQNDKQPFGTFHDVNAIGHEYIRHSVFPVKITERDPRILVGGPDCKQPYSASVFNISAMSYGALSKNAILALNKGAKLGGFAHNTGEGGISPYHLQHGGDLVWQIGTGYFGCRNPDGSFSPELFAEKAQLPQVKMIELKLSQGAKPGHGGILPAKKLTPEIIQIRHVEPGKDVESPGAHPAFGTPREMMFFIERLRDLSGGKPVGFKLSIGRQQEFLAICKAMVETGIYPDFITVDGSEGGTGAAPKEFANAVGMPLDDALVFVHNALTGIGARDKVRIIASGKVIDGMGILSKMARGADMINSARGMMVAIGCIQALQCHTNKCPTGVATHDLALVKGLDPEDKGVRTYNYHKNTIASALELCEAAGKDSLASITPDDIAKKVDPEKEAIPLVQLLPFLETGAFLKGQLPDALKADWENADPDSWRPKQECVKAFKPKFSGQKVYAGAAR